MEEKAVVVVVAVEKVVVVVGVENAVVVVGVENVVVGPIAVGGKATRSVVGGFE